MTEKIEAAMLLTHMDGHLATLSEREAPILRPVPAYADDEPPLDPPTKEDVAARRQWADRYVTVMPMTSRSETHITDCDVKPPLPSPQPATPTYNNPLAALRRERKVKPGRAAKLLGISRQRLHVVEHATKPLRCMDRLLAKAAEIWPVLDETTTKTSKGDDDARK